MTLFCFLQNLEDKHSDFTSKNTVLLETKKDLEKQVYDLHRDIDNAETKLDTLVTIQGMTNATLEEKVENVFTTFQKKIEALEERLPEPRTFTEETRDAFIAALKEAGSYELGLIVHPSQEAQNYAEEIKNSLEEAEWIVRKNTSLSINGYIAGLVIYYNNLDNFPIGARELIYAFQSIGTETKIGKTHYVKEDEIVLQIGYPGEPTEDEVEEIELKAPD